MAEYGMRMNYTETQLEFLNYDALSDDEVEKIKSFLKQPCAAVELPEVTCNAINAICDQGNAAPEYKNVQMVQVPMEYTPAVTTMTVAEHYTAHITQPQVYTVATTINGTSYIQAGYPLYVTQKDFIKIVNGGMDTSAVAATTAPMPQSAEAMLDACLPAPAGGMVVPSNIYPAHWTGLYPCPQYVLPPHMPTFLTPIAPVHPSGIRAPVTSPPVLGRPGTEGSMPSAAPYVTMAPLPQGSPVATLSATPVAVTLTPAIPAPLNLVTVPQGGIVPAVIAQEVGVSPAIIQDPLECSNMMPPPPSYEFETIPMESDDTDVQIVATTEDCQHCDESEDKVQDFGFEPEKGPIVQPSLEVSLEEDTESEECDNGRVANVCRERHLEAPEQIATPCTNSWGTPKSWASLFKKEDTALPPPPPATQVEVKVLASPVIMPSVPINEPAIQLSSVADTQQADVVATINDGQLDYAPVAPMEEKVGYLQNNGMPIDQDDVHVLGESLRDMHLDHRHTSFLPRGLYNKGNWCYVNATLQALIACPAFYNLLTKLPTIPGLKHGHSSTPIVDSMVEFIHEFQQTAFQKSPASVLNARKKDEAVPIPIGQPFEPVYIYDMMTRLKWNAFEGRQEDAEEFLSCLLNGLHDEMLAAMSSVGSKLNGSSASTNGDLENSMEEDDPEDESWKVIEKRNKATVTRTTDFGASPVSDIFCGRIRSALHAVATSSATLQPFFTLQLDIQSETVWTVRDALQGLVIKESLQGYHCTKTKQEVSASRQITLEDLPAILILHLKRFVYNKDGGCQKLSKKVDFAIDLDISKELLSPVVKSKLQGKQRSYKLIAVVYHCGGDAAKGHYVADVYHQVSNAWLRADDARVMSITEAKVLNHPNNLTPYLLFYRRLDTIHYPVPTKK